MPTPPISTPWVPMWPLAAAVPAVVNGKWLKGVGGAMVWSDIGSADIKDGRLFTEALLITDWNAATENGWYRAGPGTNSPSAFSGSLVLGRVERAEGFVTQTCWQYALGNAQYATEYRRRYDGAWGPWLLNLAPRLGNTPLVVTDWNNATDNGWYYSDASTASNAPISTQTWIGMVVRHPSTGYLTQTLWTIYPGGGSARQYTRVQSAAAWGAWVVGEPRCSAQGQQAGQAMVGGASQIVAFPTLAWDSDGIRSTTSRMTVPAGLGGIWEINSSLAFAAGAVNAWTGLWLRKNGSIALGQAVAAFNGQAAGPSLQATVSVIDAANAGDFYEVMATSGVVGNYVGTFSAARLSA